MGDATGGSVHRYEGTGVKWNGKPTTVQGIQWIDDAADIVNDADLVLVVDGTTLTYKVTAHETAASQDNSGVVFWEAPIKRPMVISNFEITTIDAGHIHVWTV